MSYLSDYTRNGVLSGELLRENQLALDTLGFLETRLRLVQTGDQVRLAEDEVFIVAKEERGTLTLLAISATAYRAKNLLSHVTNLPLIWDGPDYTPAPL